MSAAGERAIEDALATGRAILKFISPNDVGLTGSHQCGFYLPKSAWQLFTPNAPEKGKNADSWPRVTWQDGRVTESRVIWYGRGTRSEYRLTRFGKGFPYLTHDNVGDLLVLIPRSHDEFLGYVLDLDEDIENVMAALGVEVYDTWGVYDAEAMPAVETEDECVERHFREFVAVLDKFPATIEFSRATQKALEDCIKLFPEDSADDRLLDLVKAEYDLFRMAERFLCQTAVERVFRSVDDFLKTAASIMNRRKSRAGRSLENQFEYVLQGAGIPFDVRPEIDGEPDVIIPGKQAYYDRKYPVEKLFMIGLKRTCKDRWRQVTEEAERIPKKHILTLQHGISKKQILAMRKAKVTLIVPRKLHSEYPPDTRAGLVSVEEFIQKAAKVLGDAG